MFQRQWFQPGSQIGLSGEAIDFTDHLNNKDYPKAYSILNIAYQSGPIYWKRQFKRLDHILKKNYNKFGDRYVSICFIDFWPDFDPHENQLKDFFESTLSLSDHKIKITDNYAVADICVFSCYGDLSLLSSCDHATKVVFLGENVRPRFDYFDFAISFDRSKYFGKNIYLPLWMLEIDWFDRTYRDRTPHKKSLFYRDRVIDFSAKKSEVIYVGNNDEPFRRFILNFLKTNRIPISEFGSHTNPLVDKIKEMQKYRAAFCMENSYYPGYTTEKLIHAYLSGSFMCYWGGLTEASFISHPYLLTIDPTVDESINLEKVSRALSVNNNNVCYPALIESKELDKIYEDLVLQFNNIFKPYI